MLDGTAITKKFYLVKNKPSAVATLPLIVSSLRDCCSEFSYQVLASTADADEYKNDVSGALWWFPATTSAATMDLLKYNPTTGEWDVAAALTDNTYGTFNDFDFFVNDDDEHFIGYQIEWRKVLIEKGAGSYKIQCTPVGFFEPEPLETFAYCLKEFDADEAEGTVRIEYNLNAITGDNNDDLKHRDFGQINFYNSLRLVGFFAYKKSSYNEETTKYTSGERVFTKDGQEPEYILKLEPVFYAVHDIFRTDIMQADAVYITDYNSKNIASFVKKCVKKSSGYEPDFDYLNTKLAPVEITFNQTFNNLDKLRC